VALELSVVAAIAAGAGAFVMAGSLFAVLRSSVEQQSKSSAGNSHER